MSGDMSPISLNICTLQLQDQDIRDSRTGADRSSDICRIRHDLQLGCFKQLHHYDTLIHLLADSAHSPAVADYCKADSTKGLQLYADVSNSQCCRCLVQIRAALSSS